MHLCMNCMCVHVGCVCVDLNEYIIQETKALQFLYVVMSLIFSLVLHVCDHFPPANVVFITKSSHAMCML